MGSLLQAKIVLEKLLQDSKFSNLLSRVKQIILLDAIRERQLAARLYIDSNQYPKALVCISEYGICLQEISPQNANYQKLAQEYGVLKKTYAIYLSKLKQAKIPQTEPQKSVIFSPNYIANKSVAGIVDEIAARCQFYQCTAYLYGGAIRDDKPTDLDVVMVKDIKADLFIHEMRKNHLLISEYERYRRHVIRMNYKGFPIDFTFFDGDVITHSKSIDYTVQCVV